MKTLQRLWLCLVLLALAAVSLAQSWSRSYEEGLQAARQNRWVEAREAFKQATAYRPEDASQPTLLPGPPTERKRWREGAPYSPNFLAAYALYRDAMAKPADQQAEPLRIAAAEFEAILDKKQGSREVYFLLDRIYERLGDPAKRSAIAERAGKERDLGKWRVDTEPVAPEEIAAMAGTNAVATGGNTTAPIIKAGDPSLTSGGALPALGRVTPIGTKYALLVANGETSLSNLAVPFAVDDARRLRDALVNSAGYPEENITTLTNATGEQILAAARALGERIPNEATVLFYYAGPAANLGGTDYLAGTDATTTSVTAGMVSKNDIYRAFMAKGARIFAFFEAQRPIIEGRYFGSEIPVVGSIAQVQATLPGEVVSGQMLGGRLTGTFTGAMVDVLNELKSNRIPILEFGWQIFYKIRRGNTGTTGGGSRQTPTLPVLTNLASDARF